MNIINRQFSIREWTNADFSITIILLKIQRAIILDFLLSNA